MNTSLPLHRTALKCILSILLLFRIINILSPIRMAPSLLLFLSIHISSTIWLTVRCTLSLAQPLLRSACFVTARADRVEFQWIKFERQFRQGNA